MPTNPANTNVDVEVESVKVLKKIEQDQYKASHPRYFQHLDKMVTNEPGLEYNIERYTHGIYGEGFVVNFYYTDGVNDWIKRVNYGPANYIDLPWTLVAS